MSSQPRTRTIAAVLAAGALLGACSDIYWDRRETIALGANDAVETNKAIQIIDPWPPHVANKNWAANGQRVEAAQERYRNNRVINPVNVTTSSTAYQKAQQDAAATLSASQQATSAAAAAPVRGP
jgi:hypothetical protein